MIKLIISGFQSGADWGAIMAAQRLGVPTGGYMPKGFKTEDGPKSEYKKFGAIETKTSDYADRTAKNILKSDCTIVFYENLSSAGTKLTIKLCEKFKKSYMLINIKKPPEIFSVVRWLKVRNHETVNVAGHRESVCPGIRKFVTEYLCKVISLL